LLSFGFHHRLPGEYVPSISVWYSVQSLGDAMVHAFLRDHRHGRRHSENNGSRDLICTNIEPPPHRLPSVLGPYITRINPPHFLNRVAHPHSSAICSYSPWPATAQLQHRDQRPTSSGSLQYGSPSGWAFRQSSSCGVCTHAPHRSSTRARGPIDCILVRSDTLADAAYCFMRPRSMPGGDLQWIWAPYK
jgi:hypothetical protein